MAEDTPELTLEQLHGIQTDPESEKKVAQSLQLPVGTYNSTPELTLRLGVSGSEAKNPGRKYARYFGFFTGTGEMAAAKGTAGFGLSWEPRYKEDGKADLQTKLFAQATKTYRLAMGIGMHDPVEVKDVLEYVQKYSVAVRFIQGDDDNIGVTISSAKE